ncbi:MAG TPA: hypothetical protein DDW50_01035 [Firmicutes bacterium]|jgi:outer membrane protein OmpA-like peptidoglycan-associated protein|nr:hypothetical protein [Bacillota bacterium]
MKSFYSKVVIVCIVALLLAFLAGCSSNEKAMVDAVKNGDTAKAQSLLDKGVSPNLKTDDGKTILMLAAYLGHTDVANALIAKGADVNGKDQDGKTALMYAAEKGNIDIAKLLLEKGADLNAVDNKGETALQIAKDNNQTEMVKFLSNWGKPVAKPTPTPTPEATPVPVVTPAIKAITPAKGLNNGSILVSLDGVNLAQGLQLKLVSGETQIPGVNVKVTSSDKVTCFFDITGKAAGQYDVVVTNPDGKTVSLPKGFQVEMFVATPIHQILKPIFFDFNRWTIRDDQTGILDQNLAFLKENPKLYVILGGHADERGTVQYNLELTAKRTQAVKEYLINRGIAAERIIIYAYGKDHPAKLGHEEAAWQYNRRVDTLEWETVLTKDQVIDETIK